MATNQTECFLLEQRSIFSKVFIYSLHFLHILCQLNITNNTPHSLDDGSVEPKRYSVDFVS